MPHIGRPYPYHPIFWATEGWFWPHFVGWKARFLVWAPCSDPWTPLYYGLNLVSEIGVVPDPPLSIAYTWSFMADADACVLTLTMQARKDLDPWKVEWLLRFNLNGSDVAEAYLYQDYPAPDSSMITWDGAIRLPSGDLCDPPALQLWMATYAEGGSPYPDY